LRVISGDRKGQKLISLKRRKIRPTSDKVKGAIFNILKSVEGYKVLDLFAGSGALGIEALSRGAEEVVFVDDSFSSATLIRKNLGKLGFKDKAKVIKKDVLRFLRGKNESASDGFNLILADPPYGKGICQIILYMLSEKNFLDPEGIVVIEHHKKEKIEEKKSFILLKQKKYGDTLVSFFKEKSKNKELL
jgi:16S rRNA (guanine966-N2)-methyltransferase